MWCISNKSNNSIFNYLFILIVGLLSCQLSCVALFDMTWYDGSSKKPCGTLALSDMVVEVKPGSFAKNVTIKPISYTIKLDPKDFTIMDDSTCFNESKGAILKVKSSDNIFQFSFSNGVKNGTQEIYKMNLTNFIISINNITVPGTIKPSPPKINFKFNENNMGLPPDFTSYKCNKNFNYQLKDQKWTDFGIDNLSHDIQLKIRNVYYQLNTTAITKPIAFDCSKIPEPHKSMVIPIAVGASLASLVIIILVVYVVLRNRSRRSDYDPLIGNNQ